MWCHFALVNLAGFPCNIWTKDIFTGLCVGDSVSNRLLELHKSTRKISSAWRFNSYAHGITYWGLKEIVTTLQTYSNYFILMKTREFFFIHFQISKFAPQGPIDNKSWSIQIMAWHIIFMLISFLCPKIWFQIFQKSWISRATKHPFHGPSEVNFTQSVVLWST